MKINYLSGIRLGRAIIAGAQSIKKRQEFLNQINVYPVPDGDTGTNMVVTMDSVVNSEKISNTRSIDEASREIADSALMGARGNSGAILAQFFHGLAEDLAGKIRINTHEFSKATKNAVNRAYEALDEPQEGTILTVISDWSKKIDEYALKITDFKELLSIGLAEAKASLERTPEKLKVLARAGVVDAGAQGFVHLLEGISQFIESGKIEYILDREIDKMEEIKHVQLGKSEITFRFCTEGLIEAEKIDRKKIRDGLRGLGDSLIVAGSTRKVRVHIHTNSPDLCFQIMEEHGTISRRKVDDMIHQNEADLGRIDRGKIALVVDSTCDIPPEDFTNAPISFVPVWVYFGNTGYVDRVTLTSDQFYQKIETDKNHPTTSQPSSADFMKVFSDLLPRYERIICLTLSKNHSGTYQAALTAKRILKSDHIEVMESKNTSIGFGLVARQALKDIKENKTFEQVLEGIRTSAEKVRTMVYLDTVNFLIRGGRVSKVKGMVANLLHMRPVLDFANGEILTIGKVRNEKAGIEIIYTELKSVLKKTPNVRIAVVHTNAPEKAESVSQEIFKRFNYKAEYIMSATPALGVHVGPGAIGVAVLPL